MGPWSRSSGRKAARTSHTLRGDASIASKRATAPRPSSEGRGPSRPSWAIAGPGVPHEPIQTAARNGGPPTIPRANGPGGGTRSLASVVGDCWPSGSVTRASRWAPGTAPLREMAWAPGPVGGTRSLASVVGHPWPRDPSRAHPDGRERPRPSDDPLGAGSGRRDAVPRVRRGPSLAPGSDTSPSGWAPGTAPLRRSPGRTVRAEGRDSSRPSWAIPGPGLRHVPIRMGARDGAPPRRRRCFRSTSGPSSSRRAPRRSSSRSRSSASGSRP